VEGRPFLPFRVYLTGSRRSGRGSPDPKSTPIPDLQEHMNGYPHRLTLMIAALSLLGMACAGGSPEAPEAGPTPRSDARALAEMEDLYWARLDSATTRYTPADVHFMSNMIGHHAQAVVMARLVPERAADPSIETLAARILRAQEDEIQIMEQWLMERGEAVPALHVHGTTVMRHDAPEHLDMPGMLTDEQMEELEAASGAEFDRLFLALMIEHHRGAIAMVRELFATDGAGQDPTVFKFASDVQVDQSTEIARMERMLAGLQTPGGLP